jgi:hypothetical protein
VQFFHNFPTVVSPVGTYFAFTIFLAILNSGGMCHCISFWTPLCLILETENVNLFPSVSLEEKHFCVYCFLCEEYFHKFLDAPLPNFQNRQKCVIYPGLSLQEYHSLSLVIFL